MPKEQRKSMIYDGKAGVRCLPLLAALLAASCESFVRADCARSDARPLSHAPPGEKLCHYRPYGPYILAFFVALAVASAVGFPVYYVTQRR